MTTLPAASAGLQARGRATGARDFVRRFSKRREGVLGLAILVFFAVLAAIPETLVGPLQTAVTATGPRLSVLHPQHATKTVPLEEAGTIVLQRRGSIRGWLDDGPQTPTERTVALDQGRSVPVVGGEFSFADVDPGPHGLWLPGGQIVAVDVAPGLVSEVYLRTWLEGVKIQFVLDGQPCTVPIGGVLVGTSSPSSCISVDSSDGSLQIERMLPGDYVLLSQAGPIAALAVRGSEETVDLGSSRLVVHAPPKRRFYLVPVAEGAAPLLERIGKRLARRVPEAGTLEYENLMPGTYRLVDLEQGSVTPIVVEDSLTDIVIQ